MTLTIELVLASLKINQRDKCLEQRSFRLTVIVGTHTHTGDQLLYLDH